MLKVTINYCRSGYLYQYKEVVKNTYVLEGKTDIDIFEQFYDRNNSIRYCNDTAYRFKDKEWELKYKDWLKSEDFKKKSFQLYYGTGTVD